MIEIRTIGGYNEVGKNCTAIKIDDEVLILDLGIYLEDYIRFTEDEDIINVRADDLIKAGAIPDINKIKDWIKDTIAIIPTHAHLDHVGAIPFLSNRFNCPVICTPYTKAVIKAIVSDEKIKLKNPIKELNVNSKLKLSENITIEFINATHSTLQVVMVAIHTKYGTIIYANDFKFDNYPVLGKKPNYAALKKIGEKGALCLICDSTYAGLDQKTPSETVAKEMLRNVMLGTDSEGKAIIITTFSSHIARLKSIIEFGKEINRKIIFLGRSLAKYVKAAEDLNLVKFSDKVEIVKYGREIKRKLKKIAEHKEEYLLVVTGHQGEPKSTLSKMVRGEVSFNFGHEDHIIFSCKVIPTSTNIANREKLEQNLKQFGVRIFKDIHVSGHAAREDLRDLINMVKPKHVIPAHGDIQMTSALTSLIEEMKGIKVHLMRNGELLKLNENI